MVLDSRHAGPSGSPRPRCATCPGIHRRGIRARRPKADGRQTRSKAVRHLWGLSLPSGWLHSIKGTKRCHAGVLDPSNGNSRCRYLDLDISGGSAVYGPRVRLARRCPHDPFSPRGRAAASRCGSYPRRAAGCPARPNALPGVRNAACDFFPSEVVEASGTPAICRRRDSSLCRLSAATARLSFARITT